MALAPKVSGAHSALDLTDEAAPDYVEGDTAARHKPGGCENSLRACRFMMHHIY